MRTPKYPSDVTDAQWRLIEGLIPVYPGGRPRTTALRDVVDAIFYVLRTGCQWRYLPKDFPPKSTVWRYFDEWRHNGTLEAIHDALRRKIRAAEKPYAPRTTASVDSLGLLLAVLVTAASVDDAQAAAELFGRLEGQPVGKVRRVFADRKYHNYALYEWVEGNADWDLVIVRRPEGETGWVDLPLRWTVERTFAWLGKCRRLSKDRERSVLSAEAFVRLAMIHLMLNRLEPRDVDAEFRYREAA